MVITATCRGSILEEIGKSSMRSKKETPITLKRKKGHKLSPPGRKKGRELILSFVFSAERGNSNEEAGHPSCDLKRKNGIQESISLGLGGRTLRGAIPRTGARRNEGGSEQRREPL